MASRTASRWRWGIVPRMKSWNGSTACSRTSCDGASASCTASSAAPRLAARRVVDLMELAKRMPGQLPRAARRGSPVGIRDLEGHRRYRSLTRGRRRPEPGQTRSGWKPCTGLCRSASDRRPLIRNRTKLYECVEVGIGLNSACKEPAASTTGPSPCVKGGGISPVLLPKLVYHTIPKIVPVKAIVRFVNNCLTKLYSCLCADA